MERAPEPELMDDPVQAQAYARADFSEANALFLDLLDRHFGARGLVGPVLDLGCGPAEIPARLARRHPGLEVDAIDGSAAMLEEARRVLEEFGVNDRVRLVLGRVPWHPAREASYGTVISNSLLHHLTSPAELWHQIKRAGAPRTAVLVMDLRRPPDGASVDALVEAYAADAPQVLQRDFRASLHAAYEPAEVRAQLAESGLGGLEVAVVSDRHLAVVGRL